MYPMEILLITLPMGIIKKLCYTAHHLSNGERFFRLFKHTGCILLILESPILIIFRGIASI